MLSDLAGELHSGFGEPDHFLVQVDFGLKSDDGSTGAPWMRIFSGVEADRADHQLHRLVCHANLLDTLMDELCDRERCLEGEMNASVHATPKIHSGKEIKLLDRIAEELEDEPSDEGSDSDSEDSDEDSEDGYRIEHRAVEAKKSPRPKLLKDYFAMSENESAPDEETHDGELVLRRWPSSKMVPELTDDGETDSEDEGVFDGLLNIFAKHCSIAVSSKPQREAASAVGTNVRIAGVVVH